ncbi:hypothetical protein EDB84DRAFT_1677797 [Lactarius hengduanensis]|nr:hypothetical protein EDB84DRAFT_1677797 [Lactarius hengduanensis]
MCLLSLLLSPQNILALTCPCKLTTRWRRVRLAAQRTPPRRARRCYFEGRPAGRMGLYPASDIRAASAASASGSSSRVPSALVLGTTSPHSKPSEELEFDFDDGGVEDVGDGYKNYTHASPTLYLPYSLRVLGPSSLTLCKRSRSPANTHIYTAARRSGILSLPGGRGYVFRRPDEPHDSGRGSPLKGKHKEGINVLGIVTPHDIDMLERVADRARLDSVYDRCDVPREATALRPGHRTNLICTYRASRDRAPGLAARDRGVVPRKPTYRLSTICFTWSVVTLWTELDRILQLDANTNSVARAHRASSLGGLVGRVRGRMCRLREALLRLLAQWQRQWKQRIRATSSGRVPARTVRAPPCAYGDGTETASKGAGRHTARKTTTTWKIRLQILGDGDVLNIHIHGTARRSGVLPLPGQGAPQLKGMHREGINVLSIVTLHDIDMLEGESHTSRGWIACTTDSDFPKQTQHYDLVIDLTSCASTEGRATGARACSPLSRSSMRADRHTPLHCSVHLKRPKTNTTASRARIAPFWAWADHGACMRTCALSAPGSAPASGAAAMAKEVVDRANSGRGSGLCANDPGAEHMCVRTETSSKGAGRRAARPHDDAVKYDSSDEDDVRAMVTRFLLSRPATVLPSTVSTLPDAQLALRNLLSPAPSPLSSFDARLVECLQSSMRVACACLYAVDGATCLVGLWVQLSVGRVQCCHRSQA